MRRAVSCVTLALAFLVGCGRSTPTPAPQLREDDIMTPEGLSATSAIAGAGGGWMAAGARVQGGVWRAWTQTGTAAGPVGQEVTLALPEEAHLRALLALPDGRLFGAGEIAAPGRSGPLGHALYQGLVVALTPEGALLSSHRFGEPGATSLCSGASVRGEPVFGGVAADGAGWLLGLDSANAAAWEDRRASWRGLRALASVDSSLAIGGVVQDALTEPGWTWIEVIDLPTRTTRWRWESGEGSATELRALQALPDGGWLAVGAARAAGGGLQPWWAAWCADGALRWEHRLAVSAQVAQARAAATGPGATLLVLGDALVSGQGRQAMVWELAGERGELLRTAALGAGQGAAVLWRDGLWITGGATGLPVPDAHATLQALDPTLTPRWRWTMPAARAP